MRLSVIIPARNESARIASTLAGVLAAAAPDTELIVVDNMSTDDTAAQVRAHGERVALVKCATIQAGSARNCGAAAARGEVLVFLDADTTIPADALRRIARHVADGFEVGMFAYAPQPGEGLRAALWWALWNQIRRLPTSRAKAMSGFMFCTRAAWQRYGPFDESIRVGEEWSVLATSWADDRRRFIYDRGLIARTSSRRMERQPLGYLRTLVRYAFAILHPAGRLTYPDHIRESA